LSLLVAVMYFGSGGSEATWGYGGSYSPRFQQYAVPRPYQSLYGGGQSHPMDFWLDILRRSSFAAPLPGLEEVFEPVKDLIPEIPKYLLNVEYPDVEVTPNITLHSGLLTERPKLSWPTEPGALYTVILWDANIQYFLPKRIIFWMVTNIPGNNVEMGNEVIEYATPLTAIFRNPETGKDEFGADSIWVKDVEQSSHPMMVAVFKQPSHLIVDETQRGCTKDIGEARLIEPFGDVAEKYNLELVAGNFFQKPYSGLYGDQIMCRLSKCQGAPFPFLLPGVNDNPECQPTTEIILDMTVRGPSPSLEKKIEYGKYVSDYSAEGIIFQVKDTYPIHSTGQATEFIATQGTYNQQLNGSPANDNATKTEIVPIGTNNQADLMRGDISLALWTYPNAEVTKDLFKRAAELIPSIPKLLQNDVMTGNSGFKVVLSRPHDQDFNPETIPNIVSKPGMVFELNIQKVKEGKEEEFQQLRKKIITRTRSSNNVLSVYTFEVDQEILKEEGGPLYYDSTNNEVTLLVFENEMKRRALNEEMASYQPWVGNYLSTFDCIMCATFTDRLPFYYYPPFDHSKQ